MAESAKTLTSLIKMRLKTHKNQSWYYFVCSVFVFNIKATKIFDHSMVLMDKAKELRRVCTMHETDA